MVHQHAHAGSLGRRNPRSGDAAQELIAASKVATAAALDAAAKIALDGRSRAEQRRFPLSAALGHGTPDPVMT